MKATLTLLILLTAPVCFAQSGATQEFSEKFDESSFELFFYKSTLRMLNMSSTQEYYEMVKDIEKAKFINVSKADSIDYTNDYSGFISELQDEGYQELMKLRHQGNDMNILEKSDQGKSEGMVIVVNAPDYLIVLDIIGTFDMQNASKLISTIQSFDLSNLPTFD